MGSNPVRHGENAARGKVSGQGTLPAPGLVATTCVVLACLGFLVIQGLFVLEWGQRWVA